MNIVVKSYAILKDFIPESLELNLPELETIESLMQYLSEEYPESRNILLSCRFALDNNIVSKTQKINQGSVIDILPPSSGG